jgi:hypothetical protein
MAAPAAEFNQPIGDSVLERVCWRSWPKDPSWVYTDLACGVRVSRNTAGRYYLRELDEDGQLAGGLFRSMDRPEVLAVIARVRPQCG